MSRPNPLIWLALLALTVMLAAPQPRSAGAQSVVTLSATPAFEGNYTPGAWLPVEVRIGNSGAPAEVLVTATIEESPFRHVQAVELPAGAEKLLTIYVAMAQPVRELRLTVEGRGDLLAEQTLAVRARGDERLMAVVADEDPRLSLPRRQDLAALPFTAVPMAPADLPAEPLALSALSLLLLADLPPDGLTPGQAAALLGWVSAGGHLVVGASAGASGALPPELIAATAAGPAQVPDDPLAELAEAPGPGPLPGVALAPAPDAAAAGDPAAPAWASRAVGGGLVTQLAFDPGLPALQGWQAAPRLWEALLRPARQIRTPLGLTARVDALQEQTIGGALSALPPVQLPPAGVIFGVLAIYAVLIGPGLALLLRRYDRQGWAWAAVPGAALLTAGLVFGLATALRPDQRIISQLSLIEQIGGGQARARTYVGLLAPQDQSLPVAVPPEALARPLAGASGLYGPIRGVRGDVAQASDSLDATLEAWQLQGLMVEQQLPLADVRAELSVDAQGPQLSLSNQGDQTLRAVVAAMGEQVLYLGDLRPGERRTARWPAAPAGGVPLGTPLSALALRDLIGDEDGPGQARERSLQAREALVNAAVLRSDREADPGPIVLAWLERSPMAVTPQAPEAARQELTLLAIRPALGGSGPATLPAGWLRPDLGPAGPGPCFGEPGVGLMASQSAVTATLALPPGLAALRAEGLTLSVDSGGDWPSAGVTTSLYDWGQGEWVEQEFDGPGDLEVAAAGPFLQAGQLLLRFEGRINEAQCLFISATVRGSLP